MSKKGLVLINFKDYKQAIGKNGINLAKQLDYKNVWLIVNAIDLKEIIKVVKKSKVLVESIDPIEIGAFTGSISFPEVKAAKAFGVLINHSEKRLKLRDVQKEIKLARKYKLKSVVCSNSLNEAIKLNKLNPDYLAIEPPELIAGTISVSESRPELIKNAAKKIKNLLVGAGIHNTLDVRKSLEYGAKGVLVSSAIVTAKNPKQVINSLIKGL